MAKRVLLGTQDRFLHLEGLNATPIPWEDGQRASIERGSFEWWYFDGVFEDGLTCVTIFQTKPLTRLNGPLAPIVDMGITTPDGIKRSCSLRPTPQEVRFSKEQCDLLFGNAWAKGDLRRYEMGVTSQDHTLAARLNFEGIVPPWRPGAGKNYYSEDLKKYFGWIVPIPYGSVEGYLTYDGNTRRVHGFGYHDHNWGNVALQHVMDHWYWGRTHIGDFSVIFIVETAAKAYGYQKIPVLMLAKGERILISNGDPLRLQTEDYVSHTSGRRYPRSLDFYWQSGEETLHIKLRQPQILEAISLLYSLPEWQQKLARLLVNPYYFRFRAQMELSVHLAGLEAKEVGEAVYELMMLH